MINRTKINSCKTFLFILLISVLTGCGEMLDNPTIDKKTGEDVNFLIVDFNFFTTRASFKLIDNTDNSGITSQAKIWFTGTHANDIVNFSGEKNDFYSTSEGQMELTFDPNVPVSANSPLEFAIHVEANGYETFSQGIQISSEGKKTFELILTKENSGDQDVLTGIEDDDSFIFAFTPRTKSANISNTPYTIQYSIKKTDLIKFKDGNGENMFESVEDAELAYKKDKEHFIQLSIDKNTDFQPSIDRLTIDSKVHMLAFQKLETGILNDIVITNRRVVDLNGGTIKQMGSSPNSPQANIFGFVHFDTDTWFVSGTVLTHNELGFSYTLAVASTNELCTTGSSIHFSSNSLSSFSIDADFYNDDNQKITSMSFKGSFPETFILENVPPQSAKVIFRNNNPSFQAIPDLEIENLCSKTYEVDVNALESYKEYQIVLKALCSGNSAIAVAPTYSGQIKIKGSDDTWQGVDMIGGVADILAIPNREYELRLLWNGEWETSTFHTKFDADGNYVKQTSSTITAEIMKDGRTKIFVVHEFEQNICDDLNW